MAGIPYTAAMARFGLLPWLVIVATSATQFTSCMSRVPQQPERISSGVAHAQGSRKAVAVPRVEPMMVRSLPPDAAVAENAAVPFVDSIGPPARPFRLPAGTDLARATDCLAAAVYYEAAGEGRTGERAVAQVVLNRLANPAFPTTVCGVVFEGAERRTGCQFTFACDGALSRRPSPPGWIQARAVALDALRGRVFAGVGHATHYHTDQVVPLWRNQLDKLVQFGPHIFYRWSGPWGRPAAFRDRYAGTEARIAALATLSSAHATMLATDPQAADGVAVAQDAAMPGAPAEEEKVIVAQLDPTASADSFPAIARVACATFDRCTFLGWTNAAYRPATSSILAEQRDMLSFSYRRDATRRSTEIAWNCREFRDRDIRTCMKARLLADRKS